MRIIDPISRMAGVALGTMLDITRFIISSTGKLLGRDNDLDLWCKVSDFQNWQFGYERECDPKDTRKYWFGPLHLVTNTL